MLVIRLLPHTLPDAEEVVFKLADGREITAQLMPVKVGRDHTGWRGFAINAPPDVLVFRRAIKEQPEAA